MEKKKYSAPKITVFEMELSQIMAGSPSDSPSDSPSGSVSGWTPDGDIKHGFGIVEEGDGDYSDDDF
nr:hypothetical protein [uncultured Prevotella sp.]